MPGILNMLIGAGGHLLSTFITISSGAGDQFGYSDGGGYGAIDTASYSDRLGTNRVVRELHYDTGDTELRFALDGTSITNADTTFRAIFVGDTEFLRSDATYAADNGNGDTGWVWSTGSNPIGTSGTQSLLVS